MHTSTKHTLTNWSSIRRKQTTGKKQCRGNNQRNQQQNHRQNQQNQQNQYKLQPTRTQPTKRQPTRQQPTRQADKAAADKAVADKAAVDKTAADKAADDDKAADKTARRAIPRGRQLAEPPETVPDPTGTNAKLAKNKGSSSVRTAAAREPTSLSTVDAASSDLFHPESMIPTSLMPTRPSWGTSRTMSSRSDILMAVSVLIPILYCSGV